MMKAPASVPMAVPTPPEKLVPPMKAGPPGPLTYFRISTDDTRGKVKAYVGQGEFTADAFPMDGGIAVTQIPRLRKLVGHLCREGFEHHVAMVRGHFAAAVDEAVSRYLGWEIYHHAPEGEDG